MRFLRAGEEQSDLSARGVQSTFLLEDPYFEETAEMPDLQPEWGSEIEAWHQLPYFLGQK